MNHLDSYLKAQKHAGWCNAVRGSETICDCGLLHSRAELAALTARLETAERERDELYKLVKHLQEMNDDALMNGGGAWSRGGATDQRVLSALKAGQA